MPSLFAKGEIVRRRRLGEHHGQVAEDPVRVQGEYVYSVQFGDGTVKCFEDDLEAVDAPDASIRDLAMAGSWGTLAAFRTAMAIERMTETDNRGTLYAYKSQRILFEPHQYKPLLKWLDSPDRRLLIADEVGLGKTIEAGLILAEMEARQRVDRVLIVCPPRLREKWRNELNRKFGQDCEIYDRRDLERVWRPTTENPRARRVRAIVSINTLRAPDVQDRLAAGDKWDLVVFDEAHHARNPETNTAKLLHTLCEATYAVLLLTATPIQLRQRDMFTLLSALRPTEFTQAGVFETMLDQFASIHDAGRLIRAKKPTEAARSLETAFDERSMFAVRDEVVTGLLADLRGPAPPDRRGWVEWERRVQELHPLASIFTRSRKRDVQTEAPVRQPRVYKCTWSEAESRAYDRLLGFDGRNGWFASEHPFAVIQRSRQAASCLPAACEHYARAAVADLDPDESSDIPSTAVGRLAATDTAFDPIPMIAIDTKYETFKSILDGIERERPGVKVLVFTYFVGSSRYLVRRLEADGIPALRIAGDVPSTPNDPDRDERGRTLDRFREDPRIRVLVSTEVGSEGLDFQFCADLVNYDLPWNPMVVEQRIGRIDRYGQKSKVVSIHNLVVSGTVEDRILQRLYDRIGIFHRSIGDLEAILGDAVSELQRDYLSGKLSPEEQERKAEQAAFAIEQRRIEIERLEREAGNLFGHEEYLRDELARIGRLGRYVTGGSLLDVLRSYLHVRHAGVRFWQDERDGVWALRLTDKLRQDVHAAAAALGTDWHPPRGDVFAFAVDGAIAFQHTDVTLLNGSHPLVHAARTHLRDFLSGPQSRLGQAEVRLPCTNGGVTPGLYYLAVFKESVTGIRKRTLFDTVAWTASGQDVDAETAEGLLHAVLEHGQEWHAHASAPGVDPAGWQAIEGEAMARLLALRRRESQDVEALYHRRKRSVTAEFERNLNLNERRLETAKANGHEQAVQMFHGQKIKIESDFRARLVQLDNNRVPTVEQQQSPVAVCAIRVVGV